MKNLLSEFMDKSHVIGWITTIMIMVNVGLGTAIVVGGEARMSPPTYQPLITMSQDRVWIWGLWAIFASALMATPFRWFNIIGLWLSMVWYTIFMGCFVVSVIYYPTSAATPIPIYSGMALISAALLTSRVLDEPKA